MQQPFLRAKLGLSLGMFLVAATVPASVMAETVQVDILKFKFSPQEVTVKAGDTVRWVNQEKRQYHSVWFEALGEPEPPYFFPGETYERIFDKTGEFPYRCGPHPEMTGIIRVE